MADILDLVDEHIETTSKQTKRFGRDSTVLLAEKCWDRWRHCTPFPRILWNSIIGFLSLGASIEIILLFEHLLGAVSSQWYDSAANRTVVWQIALSVTHDCTKKILVSRPRTSSLSLVVTESVLIYYWRQK